MNHYLRVYCSVNRNVLHRFYLQSQRMFLYITNQCCKLSLTEHYHILLICATTPVCIYTLQADSASYSRFWFHLWVTPYFCTYPSPPSTRSRSELITFPVAVIVIMASYCIRPVILHLTSFIQIYLEGRLGHTHPIVSLITSRAIAQRLAKTDHI